jgi:hypothetical protein
MRVTMLGVSILLIWCGAAVARPRDDVMMNVYRCAGHPSTRVWLDCYYGAAQPQRAALGLPPAPPAQAQLVQAPPAPGAPKDLAARDAVVAAAARCGSVSGERPWLDCYYASANPVRVLLGLAAVPGAAPPPPPPEPVGMATRDDGGFFDGMFGKSETLVAARMADYRFDRNGIFTVTLENGQVWQQLDGDSRAVHWTRDPHSYSVTISKGAFRSFNLTVKGSPAFYKVRRLS